MSDAQAFGTQFNWQGPRGANFSDQQYLCRDRSLCQYRLQDRERNFECHDTTCLCNWPWYCASPHQHGNFRSTPLSRVLTLFDLKERMWSLYHSKRTWHLATLASLPPLALERARILKTKTQLLQMVPGNLQLFKSLVCCDGMQLLLEAVTQSGKATMTHLNSPLQDP
jgi:hypothetical protein